MEDKIKLHKKEYIDWLRRKKKSNGQPYSENTIHSYVSALTTSPAKLIGIKLETTNVFEISDVNQYRNMRLTMEQAQNFDEINEKAGNKAFQYSLAYYEEFLKERESGFGSESTYHKQNDRFDNVGRKRIADSENNRMPDKNIILYGPPGTGKTYHTVLYAVSIIEKKPLNVIFQEAEADGYEHIKKRYEEYKSRGQIEFTTFHQSYGYEEFIEGIKPKILYGEEPDSEWGDVTYEIVPGVFKRFCDRARKPIVQSQNDYGIRREPTIWKMSLGGSKENPIKRDCFNNDRIRIGWDAYGETVNEETDYSKHGGKLILSRFINEMRKGDIVLILYDEETMMQ